MTPPPPAAQQEAEHLAHREHDFIQMNGRCPTAYHAFSDLRDCPIYKNIKERILIILSASFTAGWQQGVEAAALVANKICNIEPGEDCGCAAEIRTLPPPGEEKQ